MAWIEDDRWNTFLKIAWGLSLIAAAAAGHMVGTHDRIDIDHARCAELASVVYGAVAMETNSSLQATNAARLWMASVPFNEDVVVSRGRVCEEAMLDWCDARGLVWCGRGLLCDDPFGYECHPRPVVDGDAHD